MWIAIVVLVLVLIVIWIYNRLIQLKNRVQNAWHQIEVQLQRRHDLIPNLVETVIKVTRHTKRKPSKGWSLPETRPCQLTHQGKWAGLRAN